ncbi:hypothetical protein KKD62_03855, partial [Patescibacteria group bacterium]|nr:hypothetical protein [Patescibacteria group bacterium]MBU1931141.1 hypothetical protein [Patescibacteria group bacterium]
MSRLILKKSKLLFLVLVCLLAFSLGMVWRQRVTTQAYDPTLDKYWDWCFWCIGKFSDGTTCGRTSDGTANPNYYALTRRSSNAEGLCEGPDFGPVASCQCGGGGAEEVFAGYPTACASLQKD